MPRPFGLTFNEGRYGNERFGMGDPVGTPDPGVDVYNQLTGNYQLPQTGNFGTPDILSQSTITGLSIQQFISNYGTMILYLGGGLLALSLLKRR